MVLNERKIKILEAIINDYIHTAEPIGSRTIAKKYDLGISSATVRNEMSDLEDMGFIVQPHASAGRVPSDKGYRYYVDSMMHCRDLTEDELSLLAHMTRHNLNQIDYYMKEVAKAIALLTHYTTIVSEPVFNQTAVGRIQLVPIDENAMLLVLVTDGKAVKNHMLAVPNMPDDGELTTLSAILTQRLKGHTIRDIDQPLCTQLLSEFAPYAHVLAPVLNAILEMIQAEDDVKIYTSGVKNILAFPEFSNLDKARAIFQTLEEKDMLINLLGDNTTDNVQIVIGSENNLEELQDCSLIKASYQVAGKTCGSIGIIGPTRMNYTQVVSVLNGIVKNISRVLESKD